MTKIKNIKAPKKTPIIADPEAKAKLIKAAQAINVSIEDLCTLAIQGGSMPPTERITQSYTLEDLGKRLWGELQGHPKPLRVQWFEGLTNVQQTALIVVMRDSGVSALAIANEFQITMNSVISAWNRHCDDLGSQVVMMRLETIVGQLTVRAEQATQLAAENGDAGAIWRISKEYVESLQSLSVVDRAIHRVDVNVNHAFGDEQKAEVDALVELERKKEKRFAELKLADATVVESDHLPQLTLDYDDDEDQEKL